MTEGTSAVDHLQRLLSLVPYVAAQPGGVAVQEVCQRFGVSREQLASDIDTVMMVGVHPFTPDTLIEARIEDDHVMIRYADAFTRPLRLTSGEALHLIAAARGLQEVPGVPAPSALSSALDKLAAVLGPETIDRLDVDLGHASSSVVAALETGRREGTQVEIDYRGAHGDSRWRPIEVSQIFFRAGLWYVSGWCHVAEGNRLFRVDRILAARVTGEPIDHPDEMASAEVGFEATLPQIEIAVDRATAWIFESVPVLERIEDPDRIRLRLAIGSENWLARTLVQLGPAVEIVSETGDLDARALAVAQAADLLDRYRNP